jgi:hypothetical protein
MSILRLLAYGMLALPLSAQPAATPKVAFPEVRAIRAAGSPWQK